MTSPAKRKGDKAELEVQALIRDLTGWPARRKLGAGRTDDIGDIELDPQIVIEVKDRGKIDLPAWIRKLGLQKANKDAALGVIVVKKRGSSDPFEWAYVIDAATLVNILTTRDFIREL